MKKWYKKLSLLIAGVMLSVSIFSYDVSATEQQTEEGVQTQAEESQEVDAPKKVTEEADELLEAERSGLENSWRYTNGQRVTTFADSRASEFTTWPSVGEAKGIDVSHHQGKIDWKKAKEAGVDYAIIRCGYGQNQTDQDDTRWKENVEACLVNNIPFGVYIYSYADTVTKAKSEADHVLRLIQEYKADIDYPVYYDLEENKVREKVSKKGIGDIADAFCSKIKVAGFDVGVYSSEDWFENYLTDSRFDRWDRWVAQWGPKCTYTGSYSMWQCSSQGKVNGISGVVDLNISYEKVKPDSKPEPKPEPESKPESKPEPKPESKPEKPTPAKKYTKYKTTTRVNYRSGAGTSYAVKGTLSTGKTIDVEDGYSKKANGYTWYRFKMNGKNYYLASKYVKKLTSISGSGNSSSSSKKYIKYKTKTRVNYRSGAGTKSKVKGTLASGKTINVEKGYSKKANGHTWYRFKMNGKNYYIASKYLKKVSSSSASSSSKKYAKYKTKTRVNYRTGAGTKAKIWGTLAKGKKINVERGYSKKANGYTWYRFKMSSKNYYIASKYLRKA